MKKRNNKGFSLVELIIAIAILVVLTGLLAPQFMRYLERSREAKDMQTLDTLFSAVQTALADEAAYVDVVDANGAAHALVNGSGMTLEQIIALNAAPVGPFFTELEATMAGITSPDLWVSKAVNDAGAGAARVYVDPTTLQVTVWVGVAGDPPVIENAINPGGTVLGVTTVGNTFFISK